MTLETLNARVQSFEYSTNEMGNRPLIIAYHRLKKTKFNLKISASEMLCLVRYCALMIGDLIPENDEVWQLYKYLRQMIDILISPRIVESDIKRLEKLIKLHNKLYIQLFGPLKPKFHNLVHYPAVIQKFGPPIYY